MKYLLGATLFFISIQLGFSQLTLLSKGQPISNFQTLTFKKGQKLQIIAQLTTNDLDMDDIDRFPTNLGNWVDSTTSGGNLMIETFEWEVTNDTIFLFFDLAHQYEIQFMVVAEDVVLLDVEGTARISEMDTILDANQNVVRQSDGTLAVRGYKLGDFTQGGIVFWVDETGEHGLVCAKSDQGGSIPWYAGTFGNTQAKGDGPFAGKINTQIIIGAMASIGDDGSVFAARVCNELQVMENGKTYGDWYLPSKEELNLLYLNRAAIDATAQINGGGVFQTASDATYWSSTEISNTNAWRHRFDNGLQITTDKDTNANVRAIRAF